MLRIPLSLHTQKNPLKSVSIFAFEDARMKWGTHYAQFHNDDKFCDVTFVLRSTQLSSSKKVKMNDLPLDSDEGDIFSNAAVNDDNAGINTTRFGGIRLLFAAQSPVFKQMLFGSMMESNKSTDVIIHDLTIKQFQWLKAYVYHIDDIAQINPDNVVNILQMSDKYMIEELTNICIKYICFIVHKDATNEKFVSILHQLCDKNMTLVVNNILARIKFNKDDVTNSDTITFRNDNSVEMRFTHEILSRIMLSSKLKLLHPSLVRKLVYEADIYGAYENINIIKTPASSFGTRTYPPVSYLDDLWKALVVYCQSRVKIQPTSDRTCNCNDNIANTLVIQESDVKDDKGNIESIDITCDYETENDNVSDKNIKPHHVENKEDNTDENKGANDGKKCSLEVIKMLTKYFLDDFELEKLDGQFVIENFVDTKMISYEKSLKLIKKLLTSSTGRVKNQNLKQKFDRSKRNFQSQR